MDFSKLIRTKSTDELQERDRLNIVFGTSEVVPFSKTGGLADVAASLPKALAERGHRVAIVTPLYGHLDPEKLRLSRRLKPLSVPRKARSQKKVEATVWEGRLANRVSIFFIDCERFFGREGIYGYDGEDFDDNAERYAFFSRALVEFVRQYSVPCDVLHCNDWHTSLAPIYREYYYGEELADVATVLTLHNAAYQGRFEEEAFDATGLPKSTFLSDDELKFDGGINFLKGGILHSDRITTVSPSYAKELQTEEGGFGLSELLTRRGDALVGILNGADYSVWAPENDVYISVRYDREHLNGKRRNKAELQHAHGLPVRPVLPLLAFVGRLTEQKGLDILIPALRELLKKAEDEREGFQVILLGEGEKTYQNRLKRLARDFPTRVAVHLGYSDAHAHRILAGSDLLVVPSRYEPCGLTQLYAMRYGTLPLVHATGGLADTVTDTDADAHGTGFTFEEYTEAALAATIERATERYRHHRQWRPMMMNAMGQDFSWLRSAIRYEELYNEVRQQSEN